MDSFFFPSLRQEINQAGTIATQYLSDMASTIPRDDGERASSSPEKLIQYLLDQSHRDHHVAAIKYRQSLLEHWKIPTGASVLEIGCGQGEFTVCLADAVRPTGRVVAIDPALPGWGTPSIIQAQEHLSATSIGTPITFVNKTVRDYVASLGADSPRFDYAVFGHCIWFFEHPNVLLEVLTQLQPWVRTVLIAEFGFSTSLLAAFPHVLAAAYNGTVEALLDDRDVWNIRCPLTPAQMTQAATHAGFILVSQETITPHPHNREGSREVRMLLRAREFDEERSRVAKLHGDKVGTVLNGLKDAIAASVENLEGGVDAVRNMDVWVARFDSAETQ